MIATGYQRKTANMKKLILSLFTAGIVMVSSAQILNPVRFDYKAVNKGKNIYELHIKSLIEPKWHLYSVKNPEGGAQATVVKIHDVNSIGSLVEKGKMKSGYNKEFGVNEKYFENSVDFVQLVKLSPGARKITGTIEYMVCNDKQCLPPKEVEFKIKL
ncbi:MAG: protein-disulfide reductase DsbD domain-containing protein [Ginsengibacter sp.]